MNNILDKSYAARVMGIPTFWGVLSDHYVEIFPCCNENTLREYARIFNHCILPELGNIPITECMDEKLNSALERIQSKKEYTPSIMNCFEHLTRAVVEYVAKMGYCG